jgi:hypothetical protein
MELCNKSSQKVLGQKFWRSKGLKVWREDTEKAIKGKTSSI